MLGGDPAQWGKFRALAGAGRDSAAQIYHGTPITPNASLAALAGRAFCISYARPDQLGQLCQLAGQLMIDNGAFTAFTKGRAVDWRAYYAWLEPILFAAGRWAVIPDAIDAGSQMQDSLIAEWPFGHKGAPVWHMDEPIARLERLAGSWPRICIGSSGDYWKIGTPLWRARMDEAWRALARLSIPPAVHMMRGTAVAGLYPFDSADSTALAQNGWRYRSPLFDDIEQHRGLIAYADRLEAGARHVCGIDHFR